MDNLNRKHQNGTGNEGEASLAAVMAGVLAEDGGAAAESTALLRQIAAAEKAEEEQLLLFRQTLLTMRQATAKQKNVAMGIKNGLTQLEESLDAIQASRESCKRVAGLLKAQLPPKPVVTGRKRQRGNTPTPTSSPEEGKKGPREGTPGDWITVVRKPRPQPLPEGKAVGGAADKQASTKKGKGKAEQAKTKPAPKEPRPNAQGAKGNNKKRENRQRSKRSAVVVKPSEGKTYAEILGTIRSKVRPEDTDTVVRAARKTREGGLLLELEKCGDQAALQKSIQEAVGQSGEARILTNRMRLEVLDMDCLTTAAEVEAAVRRELGEGISGEVRVAVFPPNNRELRMAVVDLDEKPARSLLERARLCVGWVRCRLRQRAEVQRCHRCLGYGHRRQACKGPDRSGLCWRCGQQGHKAAACTGKPRCYLCPAGSDSSPPEHAAGSGACGAFRAALEKIKGRRQ